MQRSRPVGQVRQGWRKINRYDERMPVEPARESLRLVGKGFQQPIAVEAEGAKSMGDSPNVVDCGACLTGNLVEQLLGADRILADQVASCVGLEGGPYIAGMANRGTMSPSAKAHYGGRSSRPLSIRRRCGPEAATCALEHKRRSE
jgi:hypothetical protein